MIELIFDFAVFTCMLPLIVNIRSRIFGHYSGFSWFIFIWISRSARDRERIINHERIHFRQQVELLFILHWTLYVWYYLVLRARGLDHNNSYLNIPFEREAYQNDHNRSYLQQRKKYAWLKYI